MPRTVVVVGGGVIGLSICWRAVAAGWSVTLVDPAPASGASYVAGGMLAPITEAWPGEESLLALGASSRCGSGRRTRLSSQPLRACRLGCEKTARSWSPPTVPIGPSWIGSRPIWTVWAAVSRCCGRGTYECGSRRSVARSVAVWRCRTTTPSTIDNCWMPYAEPFLAFRTSPRRLRTYAPAGFCWPAVERSRLTWWSSPPALGAGRSVAGSAR